MIALFMFFVSAVCVIGSIALDDPGEQWLLALLSNAWFIGGAIIYKMDQRGDK